MKGFAEARKILKNIKPDIVFSKGDLYPFLS